VEKEDPSGGCTAVAEGLGEQAHPIQY